MSGAFADLGGKLAIVTGGAGGIGAGIAEMLAGAGATVVIADLDEVKARQQVDALTAAGGKAASVRLDIADEASIVSACASVVERHGSPWLLVNNAGLQHRELLLDGTAAFWDRMFQVNTRGPFLMTREIARAMVTAGAGGRIVNIASAALIGSITMGHAAYASSKTALEGLTRAAALELVAHRITVNLLLPGGVATAGAIASEGPLPTGPALRPPPLGLCEPRDIGAAVLFFASPLAGRVTNQVLAVDGGWSIS